MNIGRIVALKGCLFLGLAVFGAAGPKKDEWIQQVKVQSPVESSDVSFSTTLEGSESSAHEKSLNELFLEAIMLEDIAQAEQYLKQGADIKAKDDEGDTAAYWACYAKSADVLAFLLSKGISANEINDDGETLLHEVCSQGKIEHIKLLMSAGAHHNLADRFGNTPLHLAVRSKNVDAVAHLLSCGADPYVRTDSGNSPLKLASLDGNCEIASVLTGINFVKDENGFLTVAAGESSSSLPGSSTDSQPAWQRMFCQGYIEPLPADIESYAQEIAQALGIDGVIFFKTNQISHACDVLFPKLGLSDRELRSGYKAVRKGDPNAIKEFKRVLYHELTHLKLKHFTQRKIQDQDCYSLLALSQEMEAELSAMYYLFTRDKIALLCHYQGGDALHPSEDQLRFNMHLFDRLLKNPNIGYEVVHDLAAIYFQEKLTGMRILQDMPPTVAKELVNRGFLSRKGYREYSHSSGCCVIG